MPLTKRINAAVLDLDELFNEIEPNDTEVAIAKTDPEEIDPDFSPYKSARLDRKNKKIEVDEEYLAKHMHVRPQWPEVTAEWKPRIVKDYELVKLMYFDIETTGLDPTECRTTIIGMKLSKNFTCGDMSDEGLKLFKAGFLLVAREVDDDDAERELLTKFVKALKILNPEIISAHNGTAFDFPFLKKRMEILDVPNDIHIFKTPKIMSSASMFGNAIRYNPVYLHPPESFIGNDGREIEYIRNDGTFIQIIDTLHLAAQLDKILAIYKNYKLKYLAFLMGTKEDEEPELDYKQIVEYWYSGDPEKMAKLYHYAVMDLVFQEDVTNYLLPAIWYQQMFTPLAVQDISLASPPKKWNALLAETYKPYHKGRLPNGDYFEMPKPDEKYKYEGALVGCNPGIYKYYLKIDVAALYPATIIRYLLGTKKDPLCLAIIVMMTTQEMRGIFKKFATEDIDLIEKAMKSEIYQTVKDFFGDIDINNIPEALLDKIKSTDKSIKVVNNGYYGGLGASGHKFNDMEAAAITTAYGRVFMRMMKAVCDRYCTVINIDTDGLCLRPKKLSEINGNLDISQQVTNPKTGEIVPPISNDEPDIVNPVYVWGLIQQMLPDDINIDLEYKEPNGVMFAAKRKNYIYWKDINAKPKKVGVFRKRNRTKLQQNFAVEYVHAIAFFNKTMAQSYVEKCREKINYGILEIDSKITAYTDYHPNDIPQDILDTVVQTHKIPKSDICLTGYGVGNHGDIISYYWGGLQTYTKTGKKSKNLKRFPIKVRETEDGQWIIDEEQGYKSLSEIMDDDDIYPQINLKFYHDQINKMQDEIDKIMIEQEIRESFEIELMELEIDTDVLSSLTPISYRLGRNVIEHLTHTIDDGYKCLLKELKKPKKKKDPKDEKVKLEDLKVEEIEIENRDVDWGKNYQQKSLNTANLNSAINDAIYGEEE